MRKWRVNIVRQWTSGSVPALSAAGLTPFSLSLSQTSAPWSSSLPAAASAGRAANQDSASDDKISACGDNNENVPAATSRPPLLIAAIVSRTARFGRADRVERRGAPAELILFGDLG